MNQCGFFFLLVGWSIGAGLAWGEVYRVDRRSQWQEWRFPAGSLELGEDGSVTPRRFAPGSLNAALDAARFSHPAAGGDTVQGGVRLVGSNSAAGRRLIDGDPLTYWQPDPADSLEAWHFEIDLGRAIPVIAVRLRFPDQEGARPFREFRVFGSDGRRVVTTGEDIFAYNLIGGTTRPNDRTEVEYLVRPIVKSTTLNIGEGFLSAAEDSVEVPYALLQYVRFRASAKSPEAALAEVEIYTFGENIALGTFERGGSLVERVGSGRAMADGNANTSWLGRSSPEEAQPTWVWDLGSLFWTERVILFGVEGSQIYGFVAGIQDHRFLVSDGRLKLTGALSYDLLYDFDLDFGYPGQLTYRFSPPRPIRYLSSVFTESQSGEIVEVAVFPVGHVAQVEMTSGFLDLGEIAGDRRPKVIQDLSWEADLLPGSRVQVQTRSGNTLRERTLYFHRNGKEISEAEYKKLVKSLRGETRAIIEEGEDWSEWSTFSQVSGEEFRSPSPRRYLQVRLLLSSEQRDAAPTLRSLSIHFVPALLAGSAGGIEPRIALPGVPQRFSYSILPHFETGDSGFDRILLETPSPAAVDSLSLIIGGQEVEPVAVRAYADSLVVDLPRMVRQDTVELDFRLALLRNPTVFRAFLGHRQRAGLWQPVDPVERFATTVFLPQVPQTRRLIAALSVNPPVFTPNGDGVGDQAQIRLSVLKVEEPPEIRIYALDGALVRHLEGQRDLDLSYLYTWSGRDQAGRLVPPGIYLCRIRLEAQAGEESLSRVIRVIY